ncbi:MAG TPA: OsmC family protein [Acidimicrobiia bacterium]|nr:OsmC family protein [Acidimicrobiia bacterium]
MPAARTATARWEGGLKDGKGSMRFGGGAFEGQYSFSSRFEEGAGTNPEELIGAAHAGCFSMAFSGGLEKAGHSPNSVDTTANVHLSSGDGGFRISRIDLHCTADVPGIDAAAFAEQAEVAKQNCPVSKALAGVEITLDAKLMSS